MAPLSSRGKLVGFVLAQHMGTDTLECHPGLRRLARSASLSTNTVMAAIDELREGGLLECENQGRGRATHYRGTLSVSITDTPPSQPVRQGVSQNGSQSVSVSVKSVSTTETELENSKSNSHPWNIFGEKNGYIQTIPNLDSREAAERLAEELRAKGYTDLQIIEEAA